MEKCQPKKTFRDLPNNFLSIVLYCLETVAVLSLCLCLVAFFDIDLTDPPSHLLLSLKQGDPSHCEAGLTFFPLLLRSG